MFKKTHQVMAVCCTVAMFVGAGCANKDVVKSEEPIKVNSTVPAITPDKSAHSKMEANKPVPAAANENIAQSAKASSMQTKLEKIYFDFDKSDLSKEAREVLSKNAETIIKARPGDKITIEGNCDERGSAEYNLALGERRAKSAMQYLVTLGVSSDRLKTISYGKEKPAVLGSNESAWAKNRRDEFVYQP